jgi:hypothetical protein
MSIITVMDYLNSNLSNASHNSCHKRSLHNLQGKRVLFLSHFNQPWIFSTDLLEPHYIKFHTNLSSEIQVVPYGRTDGQTDIRKLTVAFRNFTDVIKPM